MKKTVVFLLTFLLSNNVFASNVKKVIPVGDTVGISIMTDGLLVIDTENITDENGNKVNPADKAGIKTGDRIILADGNKIKCTEDLLNYVDTKDNDIVLTLKRSGETINTVICPIDTKDGAKLGLWVRDSTAGLGTITYVDPENGDFGALGHGISDIDTDTLMTCRDGNILSCVQNTPTKGQKGTPGELNGHFSEKVLGNFSKNTSSGIFGKVLDINAWSCYEPVEIAEFSQIHEGEAKILANTDGNGVLAYTIEIKKLNENNSEGKNMVFKVTDNALIEKTGGIVQGMSGSPIIQNGKLVGAVTHVFVNDPTRGYGIFIENMLVEAGKTN